MFYIIGVCIGMNDSLKLCDAVLEYEIINIAQTTGGLRLLAARSHHPATATHYNQSNRHPE